MNFRVKSAGESPCCCVVICNLCLQPLDYVLAVFAERDSTNLTSAEVWLPIRPPVKVYHRLCHQVTVRMELKAWSGQIGDTSQAVLDGVSRAIVILVRSSELLSLVSNRSVSDASIEDSIDVCSGSVPSLSLFGRRRTGCWRFLMSKVPRRSAALVVGIVSATLDQVPRPISSRAIRWSCRTVFETRSKWAC